MVTKTEGTCDEGLVLAACLRVAVLPSAGHPVQQYSCKCSEIGEEWREGAGEGGVEVWREASGKKTPSLNPHHKIRNHKYLYNG